MNKQKLKIIINAVVLSLIVVSIGGGLITYLVKKGSSNVESIRKYDMIYVIDDIINDLNNQ